MNEAGFMMKLLGKAERSQRKTRRGNILNDLHKKATTLPVGPLLKN